MRRRPMVSRAGFAWIAAACVAMGCSSSSSPTDAADAGVGPDDTGGACAADGTAQTYVPGMSASGVNGQIVVSLVSIAPAPAIKGTNEWRLQVTDTSGAPLAGVTVVVKPYMPVHKHGTSIAPTVTDAGGGSYDVSSLVLFMPGLWVTTIDVNAPGVVDSATFSFCIAG